VIARTAQFINSFSFYTCEMTMKGCDGVRTWRFSGAVPGTAPARWLPTHDEVQVNIFCIVTWFTSNMLCVYRNVAPHQIEELAFTKGI
jgi:hypothetical protein